jgi:membrane protease YdiL (CAAX protease family)
MENPYLPPNAVAQPPLLPEVEKTPWNIWVTLLWGVVLFLIWQTVQAIGFVIYMLKEGIFGEMAKSKKPLDPDELMVRLMDGDLVGLLSIITIFAVCPVAWFLGKVKRPWGGWEYLGSASVRWWKWPFWLSVTYLLGLGLVLMGPSLGLDEMHESMVQMATSTDFPVLLFLGLAVGAPLVEEFVFRGILWRGWRGDTQVSLWITIIVTSALWACLHLQYEPILLCFIFVFGILLGLAREKTGNLWVPVAMHALNNSIAAFGMLTADL